MLALADLAVTVAGSLDDLTDNGLTGRDRHVNSDEAVAAQDLVAARRRTRSQSTLTISPDESETARHTCC